MKLFILTVIIIALKGYVVDDKVRDFEKESGFINRLKTLKELLNLIVYASGGVVLYLIYLIPVFKKLSYMPLLCLCGAVGCTLVEFGWGMLFNKVLKLDLWDYSWNVLKIGNKKIPLNIMGQVDLQHFIIWGVFTPVVMLIIKFIGV